jgi:hypothetical protein
MANPSGQEQLSHQQEFFEEQLLSGEPQLSEEQAPAPVSQNTPTTNQPQDKTYCPFVDAFGRCNFQFQRDGFDSGRVK